MIDVEEQLSAALHRYAESVQPSPAEPNAAAIVLRAVPGATVARRSVMLAAAAVVLLVGGLLAWTAGREADGPDLPPTPTANGRWTTVPAAPLSVRTRASTVWTGKEFIVWGGDQNDAFAPLSDGAAYNPETSTWRPIVAHRFSQFHTRAVWTGDRMVVLDRSGGAAYDPATDAWTELPTIGAVAPGDIGFDALVAVDGNVVAFGSLLSTTESGTPTTVVGPTTVRVWTLSPGAHDWASDGPVQLDNDGYHTFALRKPPITTDDGFIVWGDTYGWRYRIGKGWSRLTTSGVTPASDSNAVWIDGKVVVLWRPAGSSLVAVSSLDGDRWTPPREVRAPLPTLSYQIATAGNWVVVIGFGGETNLPALIDTTRAAAESMAGYPLQTVSGQAITWSGAQFFVWGGQTVRTATSTSAGVSIAAAAGPGDTSDLTNTGAIWTP